MSEELVVRCCAPTLASLKTGNIFSCRCESKKKLYDVIRNLNRRLHRKGLRIVPLRYREGSALVYVYRPGKLSRDLDHETACKLLGTHGYPCGNPTRCIKHLTQRLAQQEGFPHEIGLFLGYPPEDVDGFIHRKGEEKLTGCWKVFGDVDAAKRTFAKYQKCTAVYIDEWSKGRGIERLTVCA